MATDIYALKCRDCFNQRQPLVPLADENLAKPFVAGMSFCPECYAARVNDHGSTKEIRPIGIPPGIATAEWVDLDDIQITFENSPTLAVKVCVRLPLPAVSNPTMADGGEVRIRIGNNLYWEAAEFLDCTGKRREVLMMFAMSGARLALHYRFKPYGKVSGLSLT